MYTLLLIIDIASFIICRPLPIVGHQLSAKFTKVTRYDNEFTEYRHLTGNCSCSFVLRYSALVFSLASLLYLEEEKGESFALKQAQEVEGMVE